MLFRSVGAVVVKVSVSELTDEVRVDVPVPMSASVLGDQFASEDHLTSTAGAEAREEPLMMDWRQETVSA